MGCASTQSTSDREEPQASSSQATENDNGLKPFDEVIPGTARKDEPLCDPGLLDGT
jgi:hypothetical protein